MDEGNAQSGYRLAALLARVIEAYECRRERLIEALSWRSLAGRHSQSHNPIGGDELSAVRGSVIDTERAVRERILHSAHGIEPKFEELLGDWYRDNKIVDDLDRDTFMFDEPTAAELAVDPEWHEKRALEKAERRQTEDLKWAFGMPPEIVRIFARELGLDETTDATEVVRLHRERWAAEDERSLLEKQQSRNIEILWAKKIVCELDDVASQMHSFSPHPLALSSEVPKHLARLFEEAHLCKLRGLELACTIVCGGIIEQACKERFPSPAWDSYELKHFHKKLESAVLLEEPLYLKIKDDCSFIWNIRNSAMHNTAKYLAISLDNRQRVLERTRSVLGLLFAGTTNRA